MTFWGRHLGVYGRAPLRRIRVFLRRIWGFLGRFGAFWGECGCGGGSPEVNSCILGGILTFLGFFSSVSRGQRQLLGHHGGGPPVPHGRRGENTRRFGAKTPRNGQKHLDLRPKNVIFPYLLYISFLRGDFSGLIGENGRERGRESAGKRSENSTFEAKIMANFR